MFKPDQVKLSIVGLGYVDLSLAVEFRKKRSVISFVIKAKRVTELQSGEDHTPETEPKVLKEARHLSYTTDTSMLADCKVFIFTLPTPVDNDERQDSTPPVKASQTIGREVNCFQFSERSTLQ